MSTTTIIDFGPVTGEPAQALDHALDRAWRNYHEAEQIYAGNRTAEPHPQPPQLSASLTHHDDGWHMEAIVQADDGPGG